MSSGVLNNTINGADQPGHLCALTFFICLLKRIISKQNFNSIGSLCTIAEQTGLNLVLLETQKTDFLTSRP